MTGLQVYRGHRSNQSLHLWYWRYKARNGRIIADGSEGYSRKSGARKGFRNFILDVVKYRDE